MPDLVTNEPLAALAARIELRSATVAVVGLGSKGLRLAETFAAAGFPVIGFDADREKIRRLRIGQSYVREVPSEQVAELVRTGRLEPTSSPACLERADVILAAVPYGWTEAGEPEVSRVREAGEVLAAHLRPGQLIVLAGPTCPGTTDEVLRPLLERGGLRAGRDFFLASSADRSAGGGPVVGGADPASRDLAVALYRTVVDDVVPVSSNRAAEACQVLESTCRALNKAFLQELQQVFESMRLDVWEVLAAARAKPFALESLHPGPAQLSDGPPAEPLYLALAARHCGTRSRFVDLTAEADRTLPDRLVCRVREALHDAGKPVEGSRVAVLGLARQQDVDDPRPCTGRTLLERLQEQGAFVSYNDPYHPQLVPAGRHRLRLLSQPLTRQFLAVQDCVVIVTDHPSYHYDWIDRHARLIVDPWGALRRHGLAPVCRTV
jgi:UDP-N-acetyl-D-glucosamine dehydrogenase